MYRAALLVLALPAAIFAQADQVSRDWNQPIRAAGSVDTVPSRMILPVASTTQTEELFNDTSIPA